MIHVSVVGRLDSIISAEPIRTAGTRATLERFLGDAAQRFSATANFRTRTSSGAGADRRQDAARALADAVVRALDGGDVVGARAAAAALVEFIEGLEGKDSRGSLDRAEAKVRNG